MIWGNPRQALSYEGGANDTMWLDGFRQGRGRQRTKVSPGFYPNEPTGAEGPAMRGDPRSV